MDLERRIMEDLLDIDLKKETWRTIDIQVKNEVLHGFSLWKLIWGTDIWINNVPILKCIVAANIIVWIVLFVL